MAVQLEAVDGDRETARGNRPWRVDVAEGEKEESSTRMGTGWVRGTQRWGWAAERKPMAARRACRGGTDRVVECFNRLLGGRSREAHGCSMCGELSLGSLEMEYRPGRQLWTTLRMTTGHDVLVEARQNQHVGKDERAWEHRMTRVVGEEGPQAGRNGEGGFGGAAAEGELCARARVLISQRGKEGVKSGRG